MGRSTDFSNCYIYHIKSKDGVVHYVGSTSNINSRRSKHRYCCSHEKDKNYNLDIYKYIRDQGGFDQFEIIPISKIENISNKTDLLIAERLEMEKHSGLKNMKGSYLSGEERIEQQRQWVKNNPEKNAEYCKKYYESNKDQINQQTRQWQKNNPEKKREINRKYRETNREKINERQRQKRLESKKELKNTDQ